MKKRPQSSKQMKLPEWNSYSSDLNQYKLTQAELVEFLFQLQKKVSMMSKNQIEAKEQWQQRQFKLQKNIKDQEVEQIYKTALESKNLINKPNYKHRKQMESSQIKKNSIKEIQDNLQKTRKFIQKVEKIQNSNDQSKIPSKILTIVKQMEHIEETVEVPPKPQNEMNDLLSHLAKIEQNIKFMENQLQNSQKDKLIPENVENQQNLNDQIQQIKENSQQLLYKNNIQYQAEKYSFINHQEIRQNTNQFIQDKNQSPTKILDFSQLQDFGNSKNTIHNYKESQLSQYTHQNNYIKEQRYQNDKQLQFKDLYESLLGEDSEEKEEKQEITPEKSISFDLTESNQSSRQSQSFQNIKNQSQNPIYLFHNHAIKEQFSNNYEQNQRNHMICDFSQPQNVMNINEITKSQISDSFFESKRSQNIFQNNDIKIQQRKDSDNFDEDLMLKSIQDMMDTTRRDLEKMNKHSNENSMIKQEKAIKQQINQFQYHDFLGDSELQPRKLDIQNFQTKQFMFK